MVDERCAYCDIFSGVAKGPPTALDEPELVSFMGRFQPTGPGYSLVVPRRHIATIHELEDAELGPMLDAVRRVASAVTRAFGVTGITVMQNNGPPAQRVPHLHFHVVPRWEGDGYPKSTETEVPEDVLRSQAQLLRPLLRRAAGRDG